MVADAPVSAKGRLLAVDQCRVSVSITSTVSSSVEFSPRPPATMRDFPLHMTAVPFRLVGMGGKCSTHLPSSLKVNSWLVTLSLLSPPMAVKWLLTTAKLEFL